MLTHGVDLPCVSAAAATVVTEPPVCEREFLRRFLSPMASAFTEWAYPHARWLYGYFRRLSRAKSDLFLGPKIKANSGIGKQCTQTIIAVSPNHSAYNNGIRRPESGSVLLYLSNVFIVPDLTAIPLVCTKYF